MAKPPRQSGQRVTFTAESAKRIAAVVRAAERGDGSIAAAPLRTSGDDSGIVRGTFSGAWEKDTKKTVTDATLSSVTYEAKNYFASAGSSSSTQPQQCVIGFVGGEWVLINATPSLTAITVITSVEIVGNVLRFATSKVNVLGPGFEPSTIDLELETC